MRIDFQSLSEKGVSEPWDVCVIGSGPAGMTVATTISKKRKSVLLIEAGGSEPTFDSQDAYQGTVIGDTYFDLDKTRLRMLGGSSNHWAGICRPLDSHDFLHKPDFPLAEWPITALDLAPYLDEAQRILNISNVPPNQILDNSKGIEEIFFSNSEPIARFGEKFSSHINRSDYLAYSTKTMVTRLWPSSQPTSRIEISDPTGERAVISASIVVLATGGIENSRLLLWSQYLAEKQIFLPVCPVGKYWMEHPHFKLGDVIIDTSLKKFFGLSAKMQRNLGILNCGLRLQDQLHYSGMKKLLADLACVAPELGKRLAALTDQNLVCGSELRAAWEQEPRAENRIELHLNVKDRFGIPRPKLFWRKSNRDLATARSTATAFGQYLAISGRGRVRLDDWIVADAAEWPEYDEIGGHHHMGGTRMSATPEFGVVDANCKLFGSSHIYVAGSSVFPSGGHANPTLTIVQLALRLSDYLAT